MSVFLQAKHFLRPLARRLANEGSVLDPGGLPIVEQPLLPRELVLATLGTRDQGTGPSVWAVRWWDGTQWSPQSWAVLEMDHFMDGNRGAEVSSGFSLKPSGLLAGLPVWSSPNVLAVVSKLAHSGPVSIRLSVPDLVPFDMVLGAVGWSLYGLLEGLDCPIEQFWRSPHPLKESWVCGVLVTRHPFPHSMASTRVQHPTSPALERHFWLYDAVPFASAITTTSTVLGVVTAWGAKNPLIPSMHPLKEAARRVLRTAGGLDYPLVQYRSDPFQWSIPQWEHLDSLGV